MQYVNLSMVEIFSVHKPEVSWKTTKLWNKLTIGTVMQWVYEARGTVRVAAKVENKHDRIWPVKHEVMAA